MNGGGNGVMPLAQVQRDLASTSRILADVLEAIGHYGPPVAIERLAKELGLNCDDTRRALIALEYAGLVETTHFRVTSAGLRTTEQM